MDKRLEKYIDKLIEGKLEETSITGGGEAFSGKYFISKRKSLNEVSYRRFNENVSRISAERKITRALHEIRKRIKEINQVIEYSTRLKEENTVRKETFWDSKREQVESLAEQVNQLSSKIRNLAQ